MLAGEAVVAIWNGIAPEMQADFIEWHNREHVPERVGIPGFRRGRRWVAADAATRPAYFTLYELDTLQVAQGSDYQNRLNSPTPWTQRVMPGFRDTARALSRVLLSLGPGMGGAILTLRLDVPDDRLGEVRQAVMACLEAPRVVGVHLCEGDGAASAVATAEAKARTGNQAPPSRFILIEATDPEALAGLLADGLPGTVERGVYRLEYVRVKTGFAA